HNTLDDGLVDKKSIDTLQITLESIGQFAVEEADGRGNKPQFTFVDGEIDYPVWCVGVEPASHVFHGAHITQPVDLKSQSV
ncbi:hypothetical protein E4U16_001192, partial [Claviceps sp. LM84 group G4]